VKQKINLNNPNLYNDLLNSLWKIFIQELDHKSILTDLPNSAEECVSLSHGRSCLPNQEALEYVIRKLNNQKPVQINSIYQYQTSNNKSSDSE
jgi:hypothetical protein